MPKTTVILPRLVDHIAGILGSTAFGESWSKIPKSENVIIKCVWLSIIHKMTSLKEDHLSQWGLAEKHRFGCFRFQQISIKLEFNRQKIISNVTNGIQQIWDPLELDGYNLNRLSIILDFNRYFQKIFKIKEKILFKADKTVLTLTTTFP